VVTVTYASMHQLHELSSVSS